MQDKITLVNLILFRTIQNLRFQFHLEKCISDDIIFDISIINDHFLKPSLKIKNIYPGRGKVDPFHQSLSPFPHKRKKEELQEQS